jgi:hypothetical protein
MTIAAKFRERQLATGRAPFPQAILTVAMDQHNVHCMTEDMLDEWFRSLTPAEKADIFDAHLGAPDLLSAHADGSIFPKPFASGGIVALNAVTEGLPLPLGINVPCPGSITVGLPALGAPALSEVQTDHARRLDSGSALRTQLRESLAQLDQVDAPAPHLPNVVAMPVEVLR